MKKKKLECFLCGGNVLYDEIKQNYVCAKCNATHDEKVFEVEKNKNRRYSLKRIRILVAILATLYVLYYFFRYIS